MRQIAFSFALVAFDAFVTAIAATDRIPTAITQAAANPGNDSNVASGPGPVRAKFDTKFAVPRTDTVLYIGGGAKVPRTSLQILLSRVQLDLIYLIADHGPGGIPYTKGVHLPRYTFRTTTPMQRACYFFVNVFNGQRLDYGLVNETVLGLKMFILETGHAENVVFNVENQRLIKAFGGLSVGGRVAEAMSNNSSISDENILQSGLTAAKVDLECTFGGSLSRRAIMQVLTLAHEEANTTIQRTTTTGLLPGPTGEWDTEGELGADLGIVGIAPAHLTWGLMQAAVQALKLVINKDKMSREVTCTMLVGKNVVGSVSVTKDGPSIGQQ